MQAPSAVVLIRPHHFTPNRATAADNTFQAADAIRTAAQLATAAYEEVTAAANALADAGVLALSARAAASLSDEQRATIERSCRILPLEVPTIELAVGSVRCMVAGIHLTARPVIVAEADRPLRGADGVASTRELFAAAIA